MLHLRLGKLLHLALNFVTFTVGITFSVVITVSGDTQVTSSYHFADKSLLARCKQCLCQFGCNFFWHFWLPDAVFRGNAVKELLNTQFRMDSLSSL